MSRGFHAFVTTYVWSHCVPVNLLEFTISTCASVALQQSYYSLLYLLCFIIILFIDSFINLIQFSFSQFQDSFLSLQFSLNSLKPICFGLGLINFTILPLALVFYFYF